LPGLTKKFRGKYWFDAALFEMSANPVGGPPNDMAIALCRFRFHLEREIVGDTNRTHDFQTNTGLRQIAHDAVNDTCGIKNN
jgi:hypothetical protein